jgi:hypothetical protein
MSVHLPRPIELCVDTENSDDVEALSECFAANAVVRDEGRTHAGLAAIKQWRIEARRKYHHTVAPLEIAQRGGKTILKARLTGTFPGSPVTLEFSFCAEGWKIASLEIH